MTSSAAAEIVGGLDQQDGPRAAALAAPAASRRHDITVVSVIMAAQVAWLATLAYLAWTLLH